MKVISFLLIQPLLAILTAHSAFGQNVLEVLPKGARSVGMASTGLNSVDAWSFFNNIGALARVKDSHAFFGYDHRFQLQELTTLFAGANISHEKFSYGIAVSHFGDEAFNQRNFGLGFSHQLGIASLGVKINYLQTNIEGFGRTALPVLELGGVADLGPQLLFGAFIYNPTRMGYDNRVETTLPTILKAALTFLVNEKVNVNVEVEKEIISSPIFKCGLEYQIVNALDVRVGTQPHQKIFNYGLGFKYSRFVFDLASGHSFNLGRTYHFSMSFRM
jgi:hypothetical protein